MHGENLKLKLWEYSLHSANIFKVQKNIIRIITRCRSRDSCCNLFKNLINSIQNYKAC